MFEGSFQYALQSALMLRSTTAFIFPSFKTTHTTLFWFLGDTQGARFYDKHGTTLHLFVILFPVQYMEKRFALETRETMTTQVQGFFKVCCICIFFCFMTKNKRYVRADTPLGCVLTEQIETCIHVPEREPRSVTRKRYDERSRKNRKKATRDVSKHPALNPLKDYMSTM